MARVTGLELYADHMYFTADAVTVMPEECQALLQQLRDKVTDLVQHTQHEYDG